jgi:UDPglucose--hexose-1-phosphate uridylyltransferase
MADFQFLQNPLSKKWVILSPRRAKRPDIAKGIEPVCPFCPGKETEEKDVYRFPKLTSPGETLQSWKVRVINNKFPFAPIHEVIIHSPDHHKSFGELPLPQTELILQTYRNRFKLHQDKGQVYIFHNRQKAGGESLPHPHSQLAVVPNEVVLEMPRLATPQEMEIATKDQVFKETNHFVIFCPNTSQWPDEVWIAPKERGNLFSSIKDNQISDLAFTLSRLIQIFDLRHGLEFPFNFYIYPGGDWYIRIIPRVKVLGGFEVGTGIFVNTQDPKETIAFIKEHFDNPDTEKIKTIHRANYHKGV